MFKVFSIFLVGCLYTLFYALVAFLSSFVGALFLMLIAWLAQALAPNDGVLWFVHWWYENATYMHYVTISFLVSMYLLYTNSYILQKKAGTIEEAINGKS